MKELNELELKEVDGGSFIEDYIWGKIIDAAIDCLSAAGRAYIDFSAQTGGQFVIHHAV